MQFPIHNLQSPIINRQFSPSRRRQESTQCNRMRRNAAKTRARTREGKPDSRLRGNDVDRVDCTPTNFPPARVPFDSSPQTAPTSFPLPRHSHSQTTPSPPFVIPASVYVIPAKAGIYPQTPPFPPFRHSRTLPRHSREGGNLGRGQFTPIE